MRHIRVGECVTLQGKQYRRVSVPFGYCSSKGGCIGFCNSAMCRLLPYCGNVGKANFCIFKRARESFSGRRCIKGDYLSNKTIYGVGKYSLDLYTMDGPVSESRATSQIKPECNVTYFTTRRAAQAYIDMCKRKVLDAVSEVIG